MKKRIIILFLLLTMILTTTCMPLAVSASEALTDAEILAKVMYKECRGVPSTTEKAAVAWCVLNRVDHEDFPDTVYLVATQDHQFAWKASAPVTDELLTLAEDVLIRWELEKLGIGDSGRVLPKEFLFFAGREDKRNYFRTEYEGGYYWNPAVAPQTYES